MDKCQSMLVNVTLTAITSIAESSLSEDKSEIPNIILKRIKENKTIESVFDCAFDKSDCDCQSK